jgi:hypothetical protein
MPAELAKNGCGVPSEANVENFYIFCLVGPTPKRSFMNKPDGLTSPIGHFSAHARQKERGLVA